MKVLVFDTETNGIIENRTVPLDRQPEIVEWASLLVDLDSGEITDEFTTLIKPKHSIPPKIAGIIKITDAMVADKKPFSFYADRIVSIINTATFIAAHNARFDIDMTDTELERLGLEVTWPTIICTQEQTDHLPAKRDNKGRVSLTNLHDYLIGEKFEGAHRAMDDVKATARCLIKLREMGELPYD